MHQPRQDRCRPEARAQRCWRPTAVRMGMRVARHQNHAGKLPRLQTASRNARRTGGSQRSRTGFHHGVSSSRVSTPRQVSPGRRSIATSVTPQLGQRLLRVPCCIQHTTGEIAIAGRVLGQAPIVSSMCAAKARSKSSPPKAESPPVDFTSTTRRPQLEIRDVERGLTPGRTRAVRPASIHKPGGGGVEVKSTGGDSALGWATILIAPWPRTCWRRWACPRTRPAIANLTRRVLDAARDAKEALTKLGVTEVAIERRPGTPGAGCSRAKSWTPW